MYEIIICDDDSAFATSLSSLLSRSFAERGAECHVTYYPDPAQTLSALERGERCELLFQDILFGEEKGIRFGRLLQERNWDLDLVFVTSSAQYAVAGYDAHPLHYLLKPLRPEQLEEVLDRFLERELPASRFARVHRSYLVNLEHIAVLGRDRLRLSTGDMVPMSRADYATVQFALAAYDRQRHPFG